MCLSSVPDASRMHSRRVPRLVKKSMAVNCCSFISRFAFAQTFRACFVKILHAFLMCANIMLELSCTITIEFKLSAFKCSVNSSQLILISYCSLGKMGTREVRGGSKLPWLSFRSAYVKDPLQVHQEYAPNLHQYSIPNFLKNCIIMLIIIPKIYWLFSLFSTLLENSSNFFHFCNQKHHKYFILRMYTIEWNCNSTLE